MKLILNELNKFGKVFPNEPMAQHTGFRTGGAAKAMLVPDTADKLTEAVSFLAENKIKFSVIGNGSNLIVKDSGYDGIVISTASMTALRLESPNVIYCEAGVQLKQLCVFALEHSLSGLEFAYGIPGTVGGAVFMNAGAYGGEMSDVVDRVDTFDGVKCTSLTACELAFSYRDSFFQHNKNIILLGTYLKLPSGDTNEIKTKMNFNLESRKTKQPLNFPSCGSTFRRPVGGYASALIDQCGLKGFSIGGAQVSEKHAGFVINTGECTSSDIFDLIEHIKEVVKRETGFQLEPEIEILE